jgi:hypothetical protein
VATETTSATGAPTEGPPGLFVRNATGLVREVKPWQAMAINFITGAPPFVIAIALLGALSGFPGGNFFVATLITIPLALAVVYTFGLLTAAIPRSGGDDTLMGISAIAFPYRKKDLYRASVSAKSIFGVPATVIAGVGAILVSVFLYCCYFHYPFFGLKSKGQLFIWLGGAIAFGLLWYFGARLIRQREGVLVDRVYDEIPPE